MIGHLKYQQKHLQQDTQGRRATSVSTHPPITPVTLWQSSGMLVVVILIRPSIRVFGWNEWRRPGRRLLGKESHFNRTFARLRLREGSRMYTRCMVKLL